ncbi:MAG: ribonuclease P protein component [Verrucomicrobiales bacterium]|nr:ribonuclease P protein component [Verrucomicrobiales bacterium]
MKFPRSRRLTRRADFQHVRTKGESLSGRFLVLGYLRDENLTGPWKLGLITTKRLGNAVTRNRVRRRLRGIAQRIGERYREQTWMVLIARNAAANATSEQLEKEWKWLMHRADLMLPREKTS